MLRTAMHRAAMSVSSVCREALNDQPMLFRSAGSMRVVGYSRPESVRR